MSDNREFFNDDISFVVGDNHQKINSVRLFGEKLLHVVLFAQYGQKEIVCGRDEAIQNFVLLLNKDGNVERFGVFASYELCGNNVVKITLSREDGISEEWLFNLSEGTFTASGEKTLFGTLMLLTEEA